MSKRWFDFIGLILLAIIILYSFEGFRIRGSEFVPIIVYLVIFIALRLFLFGYKEDNSKISFSISNSFTNLVKKILKLIFYLILFGSPIVGILIYFYNTDPYFRYLVEWREVITLDCVAQNKDESRKSRNLFRVVKPFDRIDDVFYLMQYVDKATQENYEKTFDKSGAIEAGYTLGEINAYTFSEQFVIYNESILSLIRSKNLYEFEKYRSPDSGIASVIITLDRKNLNTTMYFGINNFEKGDVMHSFTCKQVDSDVFNAQIKAMYKAKQDSLIF